MSKHCSIKTYKILVTGGEGFIGKYLVYKLREIGHKVYVIDLKNGTELLTSNFPNVDIIYHLAAQTSVIESIKNPYYDALDNILGSIKVAKSGVKVIYAGSAASQEVLSPYGLSKKTGAEYIKLLAKDYVICNFPNIFGEGGKGVVEIFQKDKILTIYGNGKQSRDFVHVTDIVDGLIKAMDWEKGEYYLGNNKDTTVLEIAKTTRKKIRFKPFRQGEQFRSIVKNNTPNWKPTIKVLKYINL